MAWQLVAAMAAVLHNFASPKAVCFGHVYFLSSRGSLRRRLLKPQYSILALAESAVLIAAFHK